MNAPTPVQFGAQGQVLIPEDLCREFHIEDGTHATVEATPEGILLKPAAPSWLKLKGMFARQPGERSLAEEWAEHKAEELALEDVNYERSGRRPR
jgi:bifunctional DNA-binding transcriptional regulator/antitoxin component of YhaV-PrlF toxin-antitoxin module